MLADYQTVIILSSISFVLIIAITLKIVAIVPKKGDYIVCRANLAGVFTGNLAYRKGQEVKLMNARRLWYWDGAASLSQLSQEGVKAPQNCKFPMPVPWVVLTEVIEVLPTTQVAEASIKAVPIWER